MESNLKEILNCALEMNTSEIHLKTGLKPSVHHNEIVKELKQFEVLTTSVLTEHIKEILSEKEMRKYNVNKSLNTSMNFENIKLRIHILKQSNGDDSVMINVLENSQQTNEFDVNFEKKSSTIIQYL